MGLAGIEWGSGTKAERQALAHDFANLLTQEQEQQSKVSATADNQLQELSELSEQERIKLQSFQKQVAIASEEIKSKLQSGELKLDLRPPEDPQAEDFQLKNDLEKAMASSGTISVQALLSIFQRLISRFYVPNATIIDGTIRREITRKLQNQDCAKIGEELQKKAAQKQTHGANSRTQTLNYVPFILIAGPLAALFHPIAALLDRIDHPTSPEKLNKLQGACFDAYLQKSIKLDEDQQQLSLRTQGNIAELLSSDKLSPAKLKEIRQEFSKETAEQNNLITARKENSQELIKCRNDAIPKSANSYWDFLLNPFTFTKTVFISTLLSATASQIYFFIRAREADLMVPILEDFAGKLKCGKPLDEPEQVLDPKGVPITGDSSNKKVPIQLSPIGQPVYTNDWEFGDTWEREIMKQSARYRMEQQQQFARDLNTIANFILAAEGAGVAAGITAVTVEALVASLSSLLAAGYTVDEIMAFATARGFDLAKLTAAFATLGITVNAEADASRTLTPASAGFSVNRIQNLPDTLTFDLREKDRTRIVTMKRLQEPTASLYVYQTKDSKARGAPVGNNSLYAEVDRNGNPITSRPLHIVASGFTDQLPAYGGEQLDALPDKVTQTGILKTWDGKDIYLTDFEREIAKNGIDVVGLPDPDAITLSTDKKTGTAPLAHLLERKTPPAN